MKSVDDQIFGKAYAFSVEFLDFCIQRIKSGQLRERTMQGYKTYMFRVLRDVVRKNCFNYIKLLRGIDAMEIPSIDEVIADCWVFFDTCVNKYQLGRSNFYWYFNKALSRNFYTLYLKERKKAQYHITEEIETVNVELRNNIEQNYYGVIFESLGLNDLECRILRSRLTEVRTSEFLKENSDVTETQYQNAMHHIKRIWLNCKEKGLL